TDVVGATADANQNTLEIDETHTLEVTASVGSTGVRITIAEVLKAAAEAFDVSFYPNPVSVELRIELPEVANAGTFTLSAYDLLGRLVHSVSTSNPLVTLDVTDYKPGVYLVMIKDVSGKNLHILKIIKE
ncbi:MAG: T9SS type A sorting domain-containing protein, partial [Imperialibacter sp.]